LLGSVAEARHVVTEMDEEGQAHLRFGDGKLGRAPEAGEVFLGRYRIGNGPRGNVGAGTIVRMALRHEQTDVLLAVSNPLPAAGGRSPESINEAKLLGPGAFRTQLERAVTPDDYARLAERHFSDQVQHAAATRRWTGCCEEIRITIDPRDANEPQASLLATIEKALEPYRRIGHDVRVTGPAYVPLDVALCIQVGADFLRVPVKLALLDALGSRTLVDGKRGFFHPDNRTFGDGVRMSELVAAAQSVPGVDSVEVKSFKRLNLPAAGELEDGIIRLHPLEIARLDNDPDFPENGVLRLRMEGGR
jgi:predicted phage baseplate assembly protein